MENSNPTQVFKTNDGIIVLFQGFSISFSQTGTKSLNMYTIYPYRLIEQDNWKEITDTETALFEVAKLYKTFKLAFRTASLCILQT